MTEAAEGVRLQKVLANAGVASRRVCEDYIVAGRVRVNGRVVTELGTRIDPASDLVDVDGTAIQLDTTKRYVMLNKPTGVVSSMKDENGRPDLRRFTKEWDERLYNVGRLDAETSGLLSSRTTATSPTCSHTPRSASRRSTSRRWRGASPRRRSRD